MAISHTDNLGSNRPTRLGEYHEGCLRQFLTEDVDANLFAISWLETHGVEPERSGHFAFRGWFDDARKLRGVALNISNRLLMIDTPEPVDAHRFAQFFYSRKTRFQHVVSRAESVDPFWETYSRPRTGWDVDARLIQRQRLYHLLPGDFESTPRGSATIRPARLPELDALFLASVRMHREETLEDPLERDASAFRRHVRHRIEQDRTYVWFDESRQLRFKADISTRCSQGAQISGVYTAPRFRNRGIATRAMADLCRILFEQGLPRLTLYVNRNNQAAIRVYEKLGFQYRGPYRTIFVAD